ncbi:hypothetical protein [Hafnia alvei]|uniref:hypothetical protein n=1 Tax=Hafnia alvei TaxID=569 RepID=UPI0024A9CC60|nr:hypothetical protein [Hafnia alvei]
MSDSLIKDSLVKINAFCYQAERFLSEIDSRIENFKIEIAGAFNKITDEVIKINAVTESINRCTDMVTESNQQICREILNAREDIMALNQLSISLNEGVKNEIYINRREVVELKKQSNLASCKIQN